MTQPPSSSYEYVYDAQNHVSVKYQTNPSRLTIRDELYAGGWHIGSYVASTTEFIHADWLGTVRVRTGPIGTVLNNFGNLPFGDCLSSGSPCNNSLGDSETHFTDQDRDSETGLDHFMFRQYSSTQGRWMVPDPAGMAAVNPSNPQTWNRYAYVMNNPVNFNDPTGLDCNNPTADSPCIYTTVTVSGDDSVPNWWLYWINNGTITWQQAFCMMNGTCYSGPVNQTGGGAANQNPPAPPKRPTPPAPTKGNCTSQRVMSAISGTLNLALAAVKAFNLPSAVGAAGAAGGPAAPATAGVTLAYGATSITGQAMAGTAQLYSAATGNYGTPARVAQMGNILSGPVTGLGTLVAGGSMETAERYAGYESFFTAGTGLINAIAADGQGLVTAAVDYSAQPILANGPTGLPPQPPNACGVGH